MGPAERDYQNRLLLNFPPCNDLIFLLPLRFGISPSPHPPHPPNLQVSYDSGAGLKLLLKKKQQQQPTKQNNEIMMIIKVPGTARGEKSLWQQHG